MDNQNNADIAQDKKEISLLDLLVFARKNLLVALIAAVICASVAFFAGKTISTTKYTYTCSFSVDTFWNSSESETLSPSGAYSAANYAVYSINTHKVLLQGTDLLNAVIKDAGFEGSVSAELLRSLLYVSDAEDTLVINISLTSQNQKSIKKLAESYAKVAPQYSKLSYSSLILCENVRHSSTSSTPVNLYTAIAFVGGACIVLFLIFIIESLDTRVKSASEVEKRYNIANLGVIPNFYVGGGKDYKAYKKGARRKYEGYYDNYNSYY